MYFRQEVFKMAGGVLLFYVTCMILLLSSLLLTAFCLWCGNVIAMSGSHPGLSGILCLLAGGSIMLLGMLQTVFITIFFFHKHKAANPYHTIVTEKEQPILFRFIHSLVREMRAPFPKRIYLSPDVNAVVFHSPGIMGMFSRADKNLVIGLGMVNSLTISEFKMVLAHEFGHFAQRSMKLALHVYSINNFIYNILYENKGWRNTIIWLSDKGLPAILLSRYFVVLAGGLHFLFRQMHGLINRLYMRLSREMEFNADEVALTICGTNNAVSATRRAEMSNACFQQLLHKIPVWTHQQRYIRNIYEAHNMLIQYHAAQHCTSPHHHPLPPSREDYFSTTVKSQVQFRDRQASHPTQEEREQRFLAANIPGIQVKESAWALFHEPEKLQELLSEQIYQILSPDVTPETWHPAADFVREIADIQEQYAFPVAYNGYYDNRPFSDLPPSPLQPFSEEEQLLHTFPVLYAQELQQRIRHHYRDLQDATTLQSVVRGEIQVTYFTYQDVQYPNAAALTVLDKVHEQIMVDREWLIQHDLLALRYHYTYAWQHSAATAAQFQEQYRNILLHQYKARSFSETAAIIMESIAVLYSHQGIITEDTHTHLDILRQEAGLLQQLLQEIQQQQQICCEWEPELQERVEYFLEYQYAYMQEHDPLPEEMEHLHDISAAVSDHYHNSITFFKKEFLYQCLRFSELPGTR
jgi:Zn-dependent protease with chaperone function